MQKLKDAFKQNVFVTLDDNETDNFKAIANHLKLQTSEILFSEEDCANFVYLIEQGNIKIYRSFPMGEIVTVGIRRKGDLIGVAEVLSNMQRCCFAETLENCELWK